MLELVQSGAVESGNFKNGGFNKLEALMVNKIPGFPLKANPHIKSRHRFFKSKYVAICEVQTGSCSGFGWDESRKCVVADDDVFKEWLKSHPNCAGLNKKPFHHFDQLARIFGKDRAMGGEGEAAADVDDSVTDDEAMNVMNDMDDETSHRVLEQMINEGVNHRTILQEQQESGLTRTSPPTGNNKRARNEAAKSAIASEISKLQPIMEQTTMNIERIANSFCKDDELTVKRASLYDELSKMEGLTSGQVISAAMLLFKDDRMAQLYYQLPEVERMTFLLRMIN
ncbi:unnamed protein product [Linum trigynum]|uniref:Myb/SANT-like domain-containing protein n=1 Tax=Linum trigynum TaxID=586398 RepID=A0AAV2CCP5_9ROSI